MLTHIDAQGRAQMVDISAKAETARVAIAKGNVILRNTTRTLIAQNGIAKGDVFAVARVAGIMAAKRTHELIPMCHQLLLTDVEIQFTDLPPPRRRTRVYRNYGNGKKCGQDRRRNGSARGSLERGVDDL